MHRLKGDFEQWRQRDLAVVQVRDEAESMWVTSWPRATGA